MTTTNSAMGTLCYHCHPRAPSTTMMAGTAMEPPTHILTCRIPDDGDYDDRDCEVKHLVALSRTCPDDDETAMSVTTGTLHRSRPHADPNDTGCNGGDSTPAPCQCRSPASPMTAMVMTQAAAAVEGHSATCPSPAPHMLGDDSNDINGTTQYPFALPTTTQMTTWAAAEGTLGQFQLCAPTQSSAVHTPTTMMTTTKRPGQRSRSGCCGSDCAAQREGSDDSLYV
ncbi:hypothetical protein EDB85DRAFT_1885474 [Lactarius pseudohatsudake]|nr:hypothetical protein EDB85DRAFT_1885474 [Lactarius pseudohatsudake]